MQIKLASLIDKTIYLLLISLGSFTPIIFSTQNSELFEVPKMLFVYLIASLLLFLTAFKFILGKKIVLPRNLPTVIFASFVLIQTISTVFSIDKFTSIFGYPTRLNGGLLSQFSYLVIFVSAQIYLNSNNVKTLLKTIIFSAFFVSLWGIPSHFGYDPTCYLLTHQLNSTCWQIDFQPTLRIFSTLGQPNWLASYLVLAFPATIALLLINKYKFSKLVYSFITVAIFLALIFTNSRSGAAGLGLTLVVFIPLLGKTFLRKHLKSVLPICIVILVAVGIFGTTLLGRFKETKSGIASGGTESSRIRLIVWQGALDIFKKNPLLGTGPETFVFSYQKVRPLAHNQTTEWNFFYNKAHNELLNYLANIGIFGLGSYLAFVVTLIWFALKKITGGKENELIAKSLVAAILGYELTILFGFSVVVTQTVFMLFAAIILALGKKAIFEKQLKLGRLSGLTCYIITLSLTMYLLVSVITLFGADIYYQAAKETSLKSRTTKNFTNALTLYPTRNPYYAADFSNRLAIAATEFGNVELDKDFASLSVDLSRQAFETSPNNFLNVRKLINTYTLLSRDDKEAAVLIEKLQQLAPTDPQTYYTVAKYYLAVENKNQADKNLKKALELKSDYVEAQDLLNQLNAK